MLEKINFSCTESDNQNELFTVYHTRFDCMIKYNGKQFSFPYQCNTSHTMPNLKDCMECLLLDASSFENTTDILDFADEFGYDSYLDIAKIRKIYKACEKTYNRLHKMFTVEELVELEEEIAE